MGVVVSVINMKGGVGKTTIAAQLALEASLRSWRTLAIDLDPQANLSQALLGQYGYKRHLDGDSSTVDHVLRSYRPPSRQRRSPVRLSIRDAVINMAGRVNTSLDLVASQLELAHTLKRTQVDSRSLARSIADLSDDYHLILIDCAPTESILTESAYHASRFLLVPVRAEYLATIGLPLLQRSLAEFRVQNPRHALDVAGIVVNHAVNWSQRHRHKETRHALAEIRREAERNGWRVFAGEIPYSQTVPKALRHGQPFYATPHVKRGGALLPQFRRFADEFFEAIGPIQIESEQ